MRDVGKDQTERYSQEDKGALNRAIRGEDALPEANEAASVQALIKTIKEAERPSILTSKRIRPSSRRWSKKKPSPAKKMAVAKWTQSAIEKPGALKKSLGVKEGVKIRCASFMLQQRRAASLANAPAWLKPSSALAKQAVAL
jgi:hypothetical protein